MSSEQVAEISALLTGRGLNGKTKPAESAASTASRPGNRGGGAAGPANFDDSGTDARGRAGADRRGGSGDDSVSGAPGRGAGGDDRQSTREAGEDGAGSEAQGLTEDLDDDAGAQGEQDAGADAEDPPYTLKELADKLDVPLKALYALDIPMGEGKSMSLGELKDLARQAQTDGQQLRDLQQNLDDREADILTRRHQVTQILDALGGQVPPHVAQQMGELQARHIEREREALQAAIPTWSNPAAYQADKSAMIDFIGRYGFGVRDLESVTDHRFLKMIRDVAAGWKSTQKQQPKPGERPAGNRTAPSPRRAASSESLRATLSRAQRPDASKADKLAGINALLRSH